ncbi:cupin domain-containing protein [Paraburkholderia sp. SIMBA_027]|uniref:cupin domain-containing protein n=1 Tax=Paraburkholderia sp. SIMBA_027 TaxID=3085770 RepID=UPI00397B892C
MKTKTSILATAASSGRGRLLALTFAATLAGILCGICEHANAADDDVVVTPLIHTSRSWDGAIYQAWPQGTPLIDVQRVHVPAHTILPWHSHGVVNAVYLLSGSLTVEKRNGESRTTFKAGQVIADTVGTVHHGYTTDEPAEMIVFFSGAEGLPLRTLDNH